MTDPARSPRTGLGRAAMFGAASQILARGARALVGVATVAILTRYLSPADFGIFALILFVMSFAQLFSELGLRNALVRKADVTELEVNTVFWFSMGTAALISAALYLGSDLVAEAMGEPRLGPYLEITSALFVIAAVRAIPLTLLERGFRFPAIASSEVVGAIAGALTAVVLVVAGYGVEALIAQQFVMVILPTIMNLVATRWLPRLEFSVAALRPLLSFGLSMTGTGVVGYLSGTIDRPILGNRLTAADLGLLSVAGQIVSTPVRTVAMNARRVTFPILASIQSDNARIAAAHRDSLYAMFLVMAPTCFGMAALAEPLTAVFLGKEWGLVKDIVGVTALSALLWSVSEMHVAIFSVKGAVRFMFFWSLFVLVGTAVVLILAVPYGLISLVWARVAWDAFTVGLYSWFLARLIGTRMGVLLFPLARPLLVAMVMAALVSWLDGWLAEVHPSAVVRLAAGVPFGALIYGACMLLVDRTRVLQLADRVKNRKAAPPAG